MYGRMFLHWPDSVKNRLKQVLGLETKTEEKPENQNFRLKERHCLNQSIRTTRIQSIIIKYLQHNLKLAWLDAIISRTFLTSSSYYIHTKTAILHCLRESFCPYIYIIECNINVLHDYTTRSTYFWFLVP